MKALVTVVNPQIIEVTLTVTMPIGEWLKIRDAMKGGDYWPCGKFQGLIRDAVEKISQQVYVTDSEVA